MVQSTNYQIQEVYKEIDSTQIVQESKEANQMLINQLTDT